VMISLKEIWPTRIDELPTWRKCHHQSNQRSY
jgi:hypothetical protein